MKLKCLFLALSLLAVSCSPKLDLSEHFDPSLPFAISDWEKSPDINGIPVNDIKHEKLVSWLKTNRHGWKKTDHDTHAGIIIVRQGDFRILLYRDNDMVVVGINATGNYMQQYMRKMDSNELMFLVYE